MVSTVLGAVARQSPDAGIQIQFRPGHARHLGATLAGQDQQLHQWAEQTAQAITPLPSQLDLFIRQHTLSRLGTWRRPEALAGRRRDEVAFQAPGEQRAHRREGGASDGGRAPGDAIDEVGDVGAADVADMPFPPLCDRPMPQQALRLLPRAIALGSEVDEPLGHRLEGIPPPIG
ncbi:hypothetical protein D3C86_1435020 [compost metagenome]